MSDAFDALNSALAGRYSIRGELGSGGAATVFVAEDLKHRRDVAIKVLKPEIAAAVGPERFIREISITATLRHPHILPLYDSGEASGLLYYVMPLARGGSLRDKMNREGRLPLDYALRIVKEVAEALHVAHAAGIVHRDVKPENVLIDGDHVVVADFGIALAMDSASVARLTETGMSIGTPEYMSPEQAFSSREVDHRTDLYSLGCFLYEMLAGEPPYSGPTAQSVLAKKAVDPAPSVRRLRATVPISVDRAIRRCLSATAVDRFASVHDFLHALEPGTEDPEPQQKSILVLPFANRSSEADNEYFSDGLTEELIAELAHVPGLRVISRRTAMMLKDTRKSLTELSQELSVGFVVEGGVRKSGSAIRLTVHLVDAIQDAELWSETYEGSLEDIFSFQERVSRAIVRALHLRLAPDRPDTSRAPADPRAFDAYLRGKHQMGNWTREACENAKRLFSAGLEILGENALLHAGIGNASFRLAHIVPGAMATQMRAAEESARESLALDPDLVTGHVLSGLVDWKKGSIGSALRHFSDALEAEPDDDEALTWATWCYSTVGDVEFLEPHVERLLLVDPLNAFTRLVAGLHALYSANLDAAAAAFERSLALDSESANAQTLAAFTEVQLGNVDSAKQRLRKVHELDRGDIWTQLGRGLLTAIEGRPLDLPDSVIADSRKDETFAWVLAECHALLGRKASAIEWLDHALEWGFSNVAFTMSDATALSLLWGDPVYEDWKARATSRQRQVLAVARRGGTKVIPGGAR